MNVVLVCTRKSASYGKRMSVKTLRAFSPLNVGFTPQRLITRGIREQKSLSLKFVSIVEATDWRANNGVAFFVSGRPQGKARPRFTRQGRTYTPDATRTYEERVKLAYKQAGGTMINGAVFITIHAYFTPPKSDSRKTRERKCAGNAVCTLKPDVDNVAKIIMDGLNGVAFQDDKQVVSLRVTKTYKPCEAGCWVYVIPADEWEDDYVAD